MSSGILPSIILPNDIRIVQSRLSAAAAGADLTANACATLDPDVKKAWQAKKADIDAYASTEVSIFTNTTATFYERGLSLEKELDAWQAKFDDLKCDPKSVRFVPAPPESAGIDLAKWLTVGVVAAAAAYGISRVAPIILAWKTPRETKPVAAAPRRRRLA